jgi:hypothetical protein
VLVTVAEAKAHIPALTSSSTTEDAFISTLIGRADRVFAARCGYPGPAPTMEARTYVLDLAALSGRELDLEVYPVCSVASAAIDPAADFGGDEEAVPVADISIRRASVARLVSTSSCAWSPSAGANRVTFYAGYNGSSTVSGAHTSSATTITVASTARFYLDTGGLGRVVVGSEVITFTGRTSTTLTGCTRGAEGTTAASISDGATITQPTPDGLKDLVCAYVKHLFDQRQNQGLDSVSGANGGSTAFRDLTRVGGERDYIPDFILAGLGAFVLPRAMA